jgi:glucose-6-phosphate 1-epimerase
MTTLPVADLLHDLRARFSQDGVAFDTGEGGLPMVKVATDRAFATIALHGAQVLSFRPVREREILWRSRLAIYREGIPLRGGIPICWPWFGNRADGGGPAHGFARRCTWRLIGVEVVGHDVVLRLDLVDDAATRSLWPYAFRLVCTIVVGRRLEVALRVINTDRRPFSWSGALHSYFALGDVRQARIHGLAGTAYIDHARNHTRHRDPAEWLTIDGEIDRVYLGVDAPCRLEDRVWERRLQIDKRGAASTVVWNPWICKAAFLADFAPDEWPHMICIESGNVAEDAVELAPGQAHELATVIGATEPVSGVAITG